MQATQIKTKPQLYIGIDIHKRSWKIHFSTDLFDGKSLTIPPDPTVLKAYVLKNFPDHQVSCAYESGCCGYSAHRAFKSYNWNSIVVNPADISRTGKSQYTKTDKIDARLICKELKDGRLQSIGIPEKEREQFRCLFRRRNSLVKDYRKIKSKLLMQLLYLGIEIPEKYDNSNWTHAFRNWIRAQELEYFTGNYMIQSMMEQFDFIDLQIRKVSNELRKYCRKNYKKDYYLLKTIPGIGGIVACGILSELGDLRRFKNFKQLASYVGLIPCVYQIGSKQNTTGPSPRANRIMRSYFVEASWQALRFDPELQQYYRSHQGKDSKRILIKVARKLLGKTYAVIKTKTAYVPNFGQ